MTTYTHEKLLALTEKVGELATAEGSHELALSALLSAYAVLAMAHPCCTRNSAYTCARLAETLATTAAIRSATGNAADTHLH